MFPLAQVLMGYERCHATQCTGLLPGYSNSQFWPGYPAQSGIRIFELSGPERVDMAQTCVFGTLWVRDRLFIFTVDDRAFSSALFIPREKHYRIPHGHSLAI
jgi:hypothetical protein